MHLARAGVAYHADQLAAGGAAHNGIVHQHYALAFQQVAHGIQLQLHAEIANFLRRLDERAANIVVADQPVAEWQLRFRGVADGRGHARVGHRHHNIGVGGILASQQTAQIFPRFLHRTAEHGGIRTREVDMLEHAMGEVARRGPALAGHALGTDDHHLTGLDVVQICRANQIERAGLGREHIGGVTTGFHLAQREWPESVRVAGDDDAILRQKHQRKCAFELQQSFPQRPCQRAFSRTRDKVQNHFGVAGALENRPVRFEIAPQFRRVGDVPVVRHRYATLVAGYRKRLCVEQRAVAGGGVTRVPDGEMPGQLSQPLRREDLRHVAHALV